MARCWSLLPVLVLSAACATDAWVRDGSTQADLKAEREACLAESGNTSGVMNLRTSLFVERCLQDRGWRVADGPLPTEDVTPASAALPDPRNHFDACFTRCRELTDRTKEQCFDACLGSEPRP